MDLDSDLLLMAGVAGSIVLVALAVRGSQRDARVHRRMAELTASLQGIVEPVGDRLAWLDKLLLCAGKDRVEVAASLRAADYFHPHAVTFFAVLRLATTLLALGGGILLQPHVKFLNDLPWYLAIGPAAVGFIFAKIALRQRVTARTRIVARELPFVLDVMVLMLETGVSLDQCFRHFAHAEASATPHINRVMSAMVDDLGKGMSYEMALDRWADRMCVSGARDLALLFRQTILHGTELGAALHAFVQDLGEKRLSHARDVIGKKSTQMTVVMIVFLMPALMIVVAGPSMVAVYNTMNGTP